MSAIIEPGHPGTSPPCGFTLVEMLVILAILTLMAWIVFPSIDKTMQRQTFLDSARRVELGLRAARAAAIAGDAPVRFVAAPDGHGFRYGDRQDRLPDGVVLAAPGRGIAFFADGGSTGGTVDLSDTRRRWRIRIDTTLGLAGRQP